MFRYLIVAVALALASPALAQDPHGIHAGTQPTDAPGHAGMDHGQHAGHGAPVTPGIVTVPADGAMLMGPPASFSITFPHPMRLTGLTIRTAGQADAVVSLQNAPLLVTGSAQLPPLVPATYSLTWTARGQDGHTMTGTVGFMVH